MKIVFVSNFLNHHQIPFCEELKARCREFRFVATSDEHNAGYQTATDADYVIKWYEDDERAAAQEAIVQADAVIFGSCPNRLIEMRMAENKLSFLYSERFFKKGVWCRFIPRTRRAVIDRVVRYKDKDLYVLCASAYLPYDLSLLGYPTEKCYRWGYFPDCAIREWDVLHKHKRESTILWSGRFLDWKHPEIPVLVAERLKKDGYDFTLTMVGDGEKRAEISALIAEKGLNDQVKLLGSVSHEALLEHMRQHRVFMFTSDRYEGWGAVLNEAMGGGCAVVASHAIGAVPYLLGDNERGLVFRSGDVEHAYQQVKVLLDAPDQAMVYGEKANMYIKEQYTAAIAAERLYSFARRYVNDGVTEAYPIGVLSCVPVIKDGKKR